MRHALAVLALFFCAGIFFPAGLSLPFTPVYAAAMLIFVSACCLLRQRMAADILLCCAVFFCGFTASNSARELSRSHIYRYIYRNEEPYLLKGIVLEEPQVKNNRASFVLRAEELEANGLKYYCSGKVLVYLKGGKNIRLADQLALRGNIYRFAAKAGSSRLSYRNYLANRGIFLIMNVKTSQAAVKLRAGAKHSLKRFAAYLKNRAEGIISQYASYVPAAIMNAMVLGARENIPPAVYNSMIRSGTVHILVVSGFNVAIVGFIIALFLKILRIRRRIRLLLTAFCLILYCLACGGSIPVVRATVMGIFFLSGYFVKREPDIYNSLGLAAICILLANPRQLWDIGFQLSFASVIAIVYLYPKIRKFLRVEGLKSKPLKFLLEGCLVSFSAWMGTLAIIAVNFKIISPVTVLANIFIVPLAGLVTLCSFSLVLAALALPGLAPFFARSAEFAVMLLLQINSRLSGLPLAYFYLP